MNRKVLFSTLIMLVWIASLPAMAEITWTKVNELKIQQPALDTTISRDNQFMFIISTGKVLVYSFTENAIVGTIPVEPYFDRIAYSDQQRLITISSTKNGTIRMLRFEELKKIDVSGLPVIGPKKALVSMVVFSDYQ